MYYLNSSYLHFKDLNLLSSSNEQECKKSIDNLTKETKDQQLSCAEEEKVAKNYAF